MAEGIAILIVFFVVIAVAALAFTGWVLFAAVGIGVSIYRWIFGTREEPHVTPSGTLVPPTFCCNRLCQSENPFGAKFCRRCGQRSLKMLQVSARKAAVW